MTPQPYDYDVLIIGAGPAGLSFACALARGGAGLRIGVLEKAPEAAMANPTEDGRDIALTRASQHRLDAWGIWSHIPPEEVAPLREARVLNGEGLHFVRFAEEDGASDEPLGVFVPNAVIRSAVYQAAVAAEGVSLLYARDVERVEQGTVVLKGPSLKEGNSKETPAKKGTAQTPASLRARLVVAADSRFSALRKQVGIATHMFDFSRTCLVARVKHTHDHGQVAYECFDGPLTLATLPQRGLYSSIVLTLPHERAQDALQASAADFSAFITQAFRHRLGEMTLEGPRHTYPLIATYATRFQGPRFALIGDAAVGMHPITAHGFNFGLHGAWRLSQEILEAHAVGGDIGSPSLLRRYEKAHRKATLPLFLATNTLVQLYGSTHPLAQRVQNGLIRLGAGLGPVRRLLVRRLLTRTTSARAAPGSSSASPSSTNSGPSSTSSRRAPWTTASSST